MVTDLFVKVFVALWNILLVLVLGTMITVAWQSVKANPDTLPYAVLGVLGGIASLGMISLGVSAWEKLDQIATNTAPKE